jgi:hypothetical protein
MIGLFAVSTGVASATASVPYRGGYHGPFTTQDGCNATSTEVNDPPDLLSYPCEYFAAGPTGASTALAGWYYYYKYSIA